MAELGSSVVYGDLVVTGKIYGNLDPKFDVAVVVEQDYYGGIAPHTNNYALASGTFVGTTTGDYINHPGVMAIYSSTTINSGYMCKLGAGGSSYLTGDEKFILIFQTQAQLATTTHKIGFFSAAAIPTAPTEFLGISIIDGVLTFSTRNVSVETITATLATLATSTWYRVEITVNSDANSTTVNVYNSSTNVLVATATITTNIPKNKTGGWGLASWATDTPVSGRALIAIDYMYYKNSKTLIR